MPSFSMDQSNFVLLAAGFGPVPVVQLPTGLEVRRFALLNLPLGVEGREWGERELEDLEGSGLREVGCWWVVSLKNWRCVFQYFLGNSRIVGS